MLISSSSWPSSSHGGPKNNTGTSASSSLVWICCETKACMDWTAFVYSSSSLIGVIISLCGDRLTLLAVNSACFEGHLLSTVTGRVLRKRYSSCLLPLPLRNLRRTRGNEAATNRITATIKIRWAADSLVGSLCSFLDTLNSQ